MYFLLFIYITITIIEFFKEFLVYTRLLSLQFIHVIEYLHNICIYIILLLLL